MQQVFSKKFLKMARSLDTPDLDKDRPDNRRSGSYKLGRG